MSRVPRIIFISTAALALMGGGFFWWQSTQRIYTPSPELATPVLAFESLRPFQGRPFFFTPAALDFLKQNWASWSFQASGTPIQNEQQSAFLERRARENEAVVNDPKAWRVLDRQWRYSAVILSGEPASFRALLDHLRQSGDWVLSRVDATSIVFLRAPAKAWGVEQPEALLAHFSKSTKQEQAVVLSQVAHRLLVLGLSPEAETLLQAALTKDPKSAMATAGMASIQAAQFQWEEALRWSESALRLEPGYPPALVAKASALLSLKRANDALDITRQLVDKRQTTDGAHLALHARAAHAARAYQEEIEALLQIIALTEKRALPTGGWRIFLAQAYAANTQGEPAIKQFELALKEPDLTEAQRGFALKGIERIRDRKPIW